MGYAADYEAGGYNTIALLAAVILLSAGLLIYNVIRISSEKKIREQGLLKTLGTTKGQLYAITFWQIVRTVLWGSLFGVAAGTLLVMFVLPLLLSDMYLYRMGSAAGMLSFHPLLLAASVIFAACAAFLSASLAIRRVVKLSPIEAAAYMEKASQTPYARKMRRGHKGKRLLDSGNDAFAMGMGLGKHQKSCVRLWQMAWRNILRFKRRFLVSAISLTLSFIVSLGTTMVLKGADTTNKIEHEYADIRVFSPVSTLDYCMVAATSSQKNEDGTVDLIPHALLEDIQKLPGIQDIMVVRGGFGEVLLEEEALSILLEKNENPDWIYRGVFVVQEMSDAYLQELKTFAQKEGLFLDVDTVISGEGMILMHEHQLSQMQIEMSKGEIGKSFGVYDITAKNKTRDMRFCGYLDFGQKGLPKFSSAVRFNDNIYFLASEKGFENIRAKEQSFSVEITSEPGSRPALTEKVRRLANAYNRALVMAEEKNRSQGGVGLEIWFDAKLDTLEEMMDYIKANRLVMGALCTVLLLMGMVNYINVTITGFAARKKEFAVMESVGLTREQLKKMLILEGVFYSSVITVLTGIFGGGALYLLGNYMKKQMAYFVFSYPVWEFAACVAGLFLSCILIALFFYYKFGEGSVALKLRLYAD